MKHLLVLTGFAAALFVLAESGARAEQDNPPTVVELFTSQGCSSCPPADRLLGELAAREDVVAIAYHIDYWDYLGWRDPFATKWGTGRQRDYASSIKEGYVYTPQMVIDGHVDVVGSRAAHVKRAISASRDRSARRLPVQLDWNARDGSLTVSLPARAIAGAADVWAVRYHVARETKVLHGENRGRTLRDSNIATQMTRLGKWSGEAASFTMKVPAPRETGDGIAILVQRRGPGEILGAGKVTFGD